MKKELSSLYRNGVNDKLCLSKQVNSIVPISE